MNELVIAIDGPSGSGKSSTSKGVAERLDLDYLDTGSMYRAFTVFGVDQRIDPDDSAQVSRAIEAIDLDIKTDPRDFRIVLNGEDVTERLHTPAISGEVSSFARVQPIRDFLTAKMRQIIENSGRIVVEGRDITTVVAPDAQIRILLIADPNERIARRAAQVADQADLETVTQQVLGRDAADSKVNEFIRPADGVTLLDNSDLTLDEAVVEVIVMVPENLH